MKFVIQNLLSLREWQTHSEVYANALEDCRLAEELGFDAVWLAEHHFSAYGICPSLAVLAAAIARETRRVRIGTAAVSPDTFELAARRGLKILTAPSFTPFDILKKNYDTYREAWRASHGSDGGSEICLNKIVHVAESSRQAREEAAEPIRWFYRTQADLIADPEGVPAEQYRFYQRVRKNLLALSDEQALEQAAIVGDPEEVTDRLRAHQEALGVTYFMGAFSRGGIPQEKVRRSMRLFAEKAMPRFA